MPKPLTIKQLLIASLLPGLLYVALFLMRPFWFQAICGSQPEICTPASINEFDQLAFKFGSVFADFCSNIVQNTVAALAFLLPWILRATRGLSISLNLTLLSITAWNGVTIEIVRALVQRPRPLVYASPLTDGANIHQYTSFYSGHTSFVTIATLFSLLWVSALFPSKKKTRLILAILFPLLSLLTGILRVVGGRHYPTDVLGGMVFGSMVCLGVMRWLWPGDALPKSHDS